MEPTSAEKEPEARARFPIHLVAIAAVTWGALTFGHKTGLRLAYSFFEWTKLPGTLSEAGGSEGKRRAELLLACAFGALAVGIMARLALRVRGARPTREQALDAAVPWVAWGALLYGVWKTYIVLATELAHFGQYALIGALVCLALDRGRRPTAAFLLTVGLGVLDEVWQHYVLHWGDRTHFMDWSDPVLDALGAAAGILPFSTLARVEGRELPDGAPLARRVLLIAAALLLPLLLLPPVTTSWALGHYIQFPYWGEYDNDKPTHWPGPREGIPLLLAAVTVIAALIEPRRAQLSSRALAGLALLWALSIAPPSRRGMPVHEVVPTCVAPRATARVTVDGKLDEPDWARAPRLPFVVNRTGAPATPGQETTARVLWDQDALYVAFEARDPDVWGRDTFRDDGTLPGDDVVELFLDDGGDELTYYEVEVSPKNVVYDLFNFIPTAPFEYQPDARFVGLSRWDGEALEPGGPALETAVTVQGTLTTCEYKTPRPAGDDTDEGWTVELAFPWRLLRTTTTPPWPAYRPIPPLVGDRWRMGLYRVERPRPGPHDETPGPSLSRVEAIAQAGCTPDEFANRVAWTDIRPLEGTYEAGDERYAPAEVRRLRLLVEAMKRAELQAWAPTWDAQFHKPPWFGVLEFGE